MEPLRILLATDGSPEANAALDVLRTLALPSGTTLSVFCAVEAPGALGGKQPSPKLKDLIQFEWSTCEAALDAATRALEREGVTVTVEVREAPAVEAILKKAGEQQVDLVVLGAKGRSRLAGAILGSTSRAVAHRSPVPVLLARPPRSGLRSVILATDGSPRAQRAAAFLARFPLPPGAKVWVVHARRPYEPPLSPAEYDQSFGAAQAALRWQEEQAGQTVLASTPVQLGVSGSQVAQEVLVGEPGTELLRLAEDIRADLLVAGTRGVSAIEALVLGSVADRLLRNAACSVLLVP
jgi:nucleotide-binding universal stress UspA family protein